MTEPTQHSQHFELELSGYLDGEVDAATHAAVETHVRGCPACAALLAELSGVIADARSLVDRAPESSLWPGIEARIGTARARVVPLASGAGDMLRRFSFSLPQLAAAAVFVALLSGGIMWWAGRTFSPASGRFAGPAAQSSVADAPAPGADASTADFQIKQYDRAVAELQQVLAQNRGRLDPETVHAVESNLATIDAAIRQARSALMADPANPYLSGHLAEQMKRKVRVLQRTADAVTADYSGGAS